MVVRDLYGQSGGEQIQFSLFGKENGFFYGKRAPAECIFN